MQLLLIRFAPSKSDEEKLWEKLTSDPDVAAKCQILGQYLTFCSNIRVRSQLLPQLLPLCLVNRTVKQEVFRRFNFTSQFRAKITGLPALPTCILPASALPTHCVLDPSDGVFGRFDLAALGGCHTLNVCYVMLCYVNEKNEL